VQAAEPKPSWPSSKQTVYYYGEYNFSVTNFWAPYLVQHEQIDEDRPAHTGLWNLYLDEPDDVWAAHVAEFDYAVVSASSWFYLPSMLYEAGKIVACHYCLLANVTDLTLRAVRAAHGHARPAAGAVRRRRPIPRHGHAAHRGPVAVRGRGVEQGRELRPDEGQPAREEEARGLRVRFPQAAGSHCFDSLFLSVCLIITY
jgi:hypothetical protein